MQAQAPFVAAGTKIPTTAETLAEFDEWLNGAPDDRVMTAEDLEQLELYRLLGVAKGR